MIFEMRGFILMKKNKMTVFLLKMIILMTIKINTVSQLGMQTFS